MQRAGLGSEEGALAEAIKVIGQKLVRLVEQVGGEEGLAESKQRELRARLGKSDPTPALGPRGSVGTSSICLHSLACPLPFEV